MAADQVTGSAGSERCFWISDPDPEVKSRFPGRDGQRTLPQSPAGGWSGCGIKPPGLTVPGVLVRKVVSPDALMTLIPLDSDSLGFLSIWAELCWERNTHFHSHGYYIRIWGISHATDQEIILHGYQNEHLSISIAKIMCPGGSVFFSQAGQVTNFRYCPIALECGIHPGDIGIMFPVPEWPCCSIHMY